MAKKKELEVSVAGSITSEPIAPDISFTEAEVQAVADFVNYMFKNANASMSMQEARKVTGMFNGMHQHVVKIEKYIFEHRRFLSNSKAEK
jgi:hypothetical protein